MKFPQAIFPKKDRPWLDNNVCLLLGFILGMLVGSGAWEYLRYDAAERMAAMRARNEHYIQDCRSQGKLPITESDGWYRDCRERH